MKTILSTFITSYNSAISGCFSRPCISISRSTSLRVRASSTSLMRLMATIVPLTLCLASLTVPNEPRPMSFPSRYLPMYLHDAV